VRKNKEDLLRGAGGKKRGRANKGEGDEVIFQEVGRGVCVKDWKADLDGGKLDARRGRHSVCRRWERRLREISLVRERDFA